MNLRFAIILLISFVGADAQVIRLWFNTKSFPDNHFCFLKFTNPVPLPSHDVECLKCLIFVQRIENSLQGDRSKLKIQEVLNSVCDTVPIFLKIQCKDFVKKHAAEIVSALSQRERPDVCKQLRLCK